MKARKYPLVSVILLLLFAGKFIVLYFFSERAAAIEPVLNGITEIAIAVAVLYYLFLFTKWAYNRRAGVTPKT